MSGATRTVLVVIGVTVIVALPLACSGGQENLRATEMSSLRSSPVAVMSLGHAPDPNRPQGYASVAAGFTWQLGALEAQGSGEEFAGIRDAAFLGDQLIVLDAKNSRLVLAGDGRVRQTVGRKGYGPHEFVSPSAIDVAETGEVYTFDSVGRISVLALGRNGLEVTRIFRIDSNPVDGCVLNDLIFVLGSRWGSTLAIHVYDRSDGEHLYSFGLVSRSEHRVLASQSIQGRLACSDSERSILLALAVLPEIRSYTIEGQLRWWVAVTDIDLPELEAISPRATRFTRKPGANDRLTSVVRNETGGAVMVQYERVDSRQDAVGYRTVLLSVANGYSRVVHGLPRVVAWNQDHWATTVTGSPYPVVRVAEGRATLWDNDNG